MKLTLLFVISLLIAGCGFKSDLYLSDLPPPSLPEGQLDLPELPSLPTDEVADGIAIDIPPLEQQTDNKKKK